MDRELLLRARAGDGEAFELIVEQRGEHLFRTARAILGSEADAYDATQEAFIAAWRRLADLRDPDRFDAWLGRILVNACRMVLRRRGRVREVAFPDGFALRAGGPTDNPGADDFGREFDSAFAQLSADQRAILVLHHLHGYGVREIGAWLGVPTGTVKWRLYRARQALRAAWEGEQGEARDARP
jgi:RNA polymerase sigma-70 factor, ECF subfamily